MERLQKTAGGRMMWLIETLKTGENPPQGGEIQNVPCCPRNTPKSTAINLTMVLALGATTGSTPDAPSESFQQLRAAGLDIDHFEKVRSHSMLFGGNIDLWELDEKPAKDLYAHFTHQCELFPDPRRRFILASGPAAGATLRMLCEWDINLGGVILINPPEYVKFPRHPKHASPSTEEITLPTPCAEREISPPYVANLLTETEEQLPVPILVLGGIPMARDYTFRLPKEAVDIVAAWIKRVMPEPSPTSSASEGPPLVHPIDAACGETDKTAPATMDGMEKEEPVGSDLSVAAMASAMADAHLSPVLDGFAPQQH